MSRLIATLIIAIGGLFGKVPRKVRQQLQFGSFRNFCVFNIDAEQTAAVCWYRIAELAASQPDLHKQLARDFKRVAIDEDRHGKVFEILASGLTNDNTLDERQTVESLIEQIREVGSEFLPRGCGGSRTQRTRLAAGSKFTCSVRAKKTKNVCFSSDCSTNAVCVKRSVGGRNF